MLHARRTVRSMANAKRTALPRWQLISPQGHAVEEREADVCPKIDPGLPDGWSWRPAEINRMAADAADRAAMLEREASERPQEPEDPFLALHKDMERAEIINEAFDLIMSKLA